MKFKNLKASTLTAHLIVGLAYPIIKTAISEYNKLMIFTDCLTIVSFLMLIFGIIYSMYLKGDFDRMKASVIKSTTKTIKPIDAILEDEKAEREEGFNYPLLAGIIFLVTAIILNIRMAR